MHKHRAAQYLSRDRSVAIACGGTQARCDGHRYKVDPLATASNAWIGAQANGNLALDADSLASAPDLLGEVKDAGFFPGR